MRGHINKQMPAGIAMEITRFELEDTTTNWKHGFSSNWTETNRSLPVWNRNSTSTVNVFYPLTRMDGGLLSLHEADEDAIRRMKMTATKAFAKWMDGWLGLTAF